MPSSETLTSSSLGRSSVMVDRVKPPNESLECGEASQSMLFRTCACRKVTEAKQSKATTVDSTDQIEVGSCYFFGGKREKVVVTVVAFTTAS